MLRFLIRASLSLLLASTQLWAAERLKLDTGKSDDCVASFVLNSDNSLEVKGQYFVKSNETTKVFHYKGSYSEQSDGFDLKFNGVDPKKIDEMFRGAKVTKQGSIWKVKKNFEGVKLYEVPLSLKAKSK